MTTIAGSPHRSRRADGTRTAHVLLHDDRGFLTVRRLRPWHRMLARCTAARLDSELAAGTSPEASARLAGQLAKSGPVPVQGVAMISLLLADGMGPLYHDARGDDLADIIAKATRALSLPG
jgi:hypothetical protein